MAVTREAPGPALQSPGEWTGPRAAQAAWAEEAPPLAALLRAGVGPLPCEQVLPVLGPGIAVLSPWTWKCGLAVLRQEYLWAADSCQPQEALWGLWAAVPCETQ